MAVADDFTRCEPVRSAVDRVRIECRGREFSDIVDAAGHQYVDLVMQGGGVLGIALVGYTYVLEQAEIRFLGVGGTSAGAIIALLIAALGKPADAKGVRVVDVLARMPVSTFIDGDAESRELTHALIEKAGMMKLLYKASRVMRNLRQNLGLNPGTEFLRWLDSELAKTGIRTLREMQANLADVPQSLQLREVARDRPLTDADRRGRLAMVAADITTETKVEFPQMAELYWADPQSVELARFARASISIPFFFEPFRVDGCPQDRAAAWDRHAHYAGAAPHSVLFVDGGVMSNFPIDLFHRPLMVPRSPTFGVKIRRERSSPLDIRGPAELAGAIFNAARHALDDDFIVRNPDYRHLVKSIDTSPHNWLDFDMSRDDKRDLFARGAHAAAEFLCEFDWERYKKVRKELVEAHQGAVAESASPAVSTGDRDAAAEGL